MKEKLSFTNGNFGRSIFRIANFCFMIIVICLMLIPLLKVLSDSMDRSGNYGLSFIPKDFTLYSYKTIITNSALYRPFLISIYVTAVGTVLALLLTTMGAYVLTQKDIPGRNFFIYLLLFTMIFHGGLIPTFMLIKKLKLINTLWAIIIPMSINTYYLILLKNFFSGIPQSLPESAEIDGCSPMGILVKIVLPMSRPALAAIGLFYAVMYWNDFFNFTIYINDPKLYNFQVKLREIVLTDDLRTSPDVHVYSKSLQNATIVVAIIPVMILYPILQKHFVTGINLGAVKG